jgi:hypothetical protein
MWWSIAREQFGPDVLCSAAVVFVNRDRSRDKIVFHDGSGMITFTLPYHQAALPLHGH